MWFWFATASGIRSGPEMEADISLFCMKSSMGGLCDDGGLAGPGLFLMDTLVRDD